MFKWKKAAAGILAVAMTGACAACGSSTAYALTIDGVQIKAGVYIYYSYAAHTEAVSTLSSQNSELDTKDDDVVKAQKLDGVSTEEWIRNKALEYCQRHVAVEKKCEELSIELDEEELSEISDSIETFWDANQEAFERNGISKESVELVLENTYKANDLFLYYYDVDGEKGVTKEELKEYYIDNNARVRYIQFKLTDADGNALEEDEKQEVLDMAEDYLKEVKALQDDEDAMLDEMDAIQTEYEEYVAAQTATSATDEEGNEIPAETTEETEATTATEETEGADVTEAATSDAETAETTVANDAERTGETTTTAATEDTSEGETTETTTTTAPFANENIIAKVTTDEDTKEEDVTYSPSKKAYDFIFQDAKIGVPELIEDEDACYLIIRLNIEDRMNEDDLWTDTQQTSVISQKYTDAFEELRDSWCREQTVEENERAIKRYDPFKIDFDSEE